MLKGAIIGFGEVARNGHWPAYAASAEADIVAVVDRSAGRRELAASLKPGLQAFATVEELTVSASLDFVDICTPPALHPQPMFQALASGWHVLCEKPFLLEQVMVDCARALATRSGLAVVPVHNWKYAPIVRAATSALRDGAIGQLERVEIQTSRFKAAPTADTDGPNWRRDPQMAGGGILMDHGWHSIYLALHWFAEPAREIRAECHHPPSGGVEDEAAVTIEFPGGIAKIDLTWNGSVRRNAMRLVGTAGEIVVDDDVLRVNGARPYVWTFGSALSAGSAHADWFADMLPDVFRAFRQPQRSRAVFDEAAECLSLIQSAYRGSNAPV